MPYSKTSEFKYTIVGNNRIIEERNNQFTRFCKIKWGVSPNENTESKKSRYDLRRWVTEPDGSERMGKGISFLTDNGPTELVHVLTEEGFGDTEKILRIIKERDDYKDAVHNVFGTTSSNTASIDLRDFLN